MRLTNVSWLACVVVISSCRASGDAKAPAATFTSHGKPVNIAEIDSLVRVAMGQRGLVGLSVGVAQDGKIVFARGYGSRSLATHDSVTPQTMFAWRAAARFGPAS